MDKKNIYNCDICNKEYSSKNSLYNHKKKHTENSVKIYLCKYCNNGFKYFQNRWRHEKKCKNINSEIFELAKLKEETKQTELLLQVKKEESKILQLKIKLENSNKIDNMTLKKLNKLLIDRNKKIKNINTINNIQIINNFNLIGFGKEEVVDTLSPKEKKIIINAKYGSLDKLIEIVHCGKYNQFKNIILTNIKDNYMYKYDDKLGHFILSTKAEVLNSLIDYRLSDLEIIYNDLIAQNKLDEKTKDIIEKFINNIIYGNTKYTDYDGNQHENYKKYKINEIKILLFNNQDKITSDISLLLSTNEVIK
jgi:hypothetical protein